MSYSLLNLRNRAVSKECLTYEQGWQDAHNAIADYVEQEVCIVTAEMIRRMKDEKWRFEKPVKEETDDKVDG